MDAKQIADLVRIADLAISHDQFERDVRFHSDALGSGYGHFKETRGISHIERDTPEWDQMMRETKPVYEKLGEARRLARNAKRRLQSDIRRHTENHPHERQQ